MHIYVIIKVIHIHMIHIYTYVYAKMYIHTPLGIHVCSMSALLNAQMHLLGVYVYNNNIHIYILGFQEFIYVYLYYR